MRSSQVGTDLRVHPLAVASVVLSAMGFVPLIIVGGLAGAALGAVAGVLVRRRPDRWRGAEWADAGVAIGLVTGVVMLAIFGAVRLGDWGPWPLIATVAYGTLVAGVAGWSRAGGKGGVVGAGVGAGVVVAMVAAVVGVCLLIAVALGAALDSTT